MRNVLRFVQKKALVFDMLDYAHETVDLYKSMNQR